MPPDLFSTPFSGIRCGSIIRSGWIGNGISIGERLLRKAFGERHLKAAGGVLWVCICALSFLIPFGILHALQRIHPVLRFAAETFWCYQILAARSLYTESMKVYDRLKEHDLTGARKAVSMIVGRDTENLTEEGVTKAAVRQWRRIHLTE